MPITDARLSATARYWRDMESGLLLGIVILTIAIAGGAYLHRKHKKWRREQEELFVQTARFYDGR